MKLTSMTDSARIACVRAITEELKRILMTNSSMLTRVGSTSIYHLTCIEYNFTFTAVCLDRKKKRMRKVSWLILNILHD